MAIEKNHTIFKTKQIYYENVHRFRQFETNRAIKIFK